MLKKVGEVEICTDDFSAVEWESEFVKLFQENGYTIIQENDYSTPHFIIAVEEGTK